LTLIIACVIYRQAKEISRVVRWCKPEDDKIDMAFHVNINIIEFDNVILCGQIRVGPRPGPLTVSLKGYFNSNLGVTLTVISGSRWNSCQPQSENEIAGPRIPLAVLTMIVYEFLSQIAIGECLTGWSGELAAGYSKMDLGIARKVVG
jgi:hypothetical protein